MLMLATGVLGALLAGAMFDFTTLVDDDGIDPADAGDDFDAADTVMSLDDMLNPGADADAGGWEGLPAMAEDEAGWNWAVWPENGPENGFADGTDDTAAAADAEVSAALGDWLDGRTGGGTEDDAALNAYLNGDMGDDLPELLAEDEGTGDTDYEDAATAPFGPNPDGPAPVIPDYDPAGDGLVLSYDASAGPPPDIAVAPDPNDAANSIVFADGLAVGLVQGGAGITPDMIALTPLAAAA